MLSLSSLSSVPQTFSSDTLLAFEAEKKSLHDWACLTLTFTLQDIKRIKRHSANFFQIPQCIVCGGKLYGPAAENFWTLHHITLPKFLLFAIICVKFSITL